MISFSCPSCNATHTVKDEHGGKKAKCPSCKAVLVVPMSEPVPVEDDVPLLETESGPEPTPAKEREVDPPEIRLIGKAAKALQFTDWEFNGKSMRSELTYVGGFWYPAELLSGQIDVTCYAESGVVLEKMMLDMPAEMKKGQSCDVKLRLKLVLGAKMKRLAYIEIGFDTSFS